MFARHQGTLPLVRRRGECLREHTPAGVAATGVPLSKADVRAALAPGGAAGVCAETRRAVAPAAPCGPGVAVVRAFFDAVGGLPLLTCGRK